MDILYIIIGLLVGAIIGVFIGRFLLRKLFKDQEIAAQNKVKKILKDAESNAEIGPSPLHGSNELPLR